MLPPYTDYAAKAAPMHYHFIKPFCLLFKLIMWWQADRLHGIYTSSNSEPTAWPVYFIVPEVYYVVFFIKYCTGWARLVVVCLHLKKSAFERTPKTLILLIYWDYILFRQLLQKIVSHFSSNILQILISNKHFQVKSSFLNTTYEAPKEKKNKNKKRSSFQLSFKQEIEPGGNSLVLQWFEFGTFTAVAPGFNAWSRN